MDETDNGFEMSAKSIAITLLWIVCIASGTLTAQSQQIDIPLGGLPYDEHSAHVELAEGRLDSAVWEKVGRFYEEPMSVPLGELADLREVFPDVPEDIPVSSEVLVLYEPWKPADIERFFNDYPYLRVFTPLMRFDVAQLPITGYCTVSMRRSGYTDAFSPSLRFGVDPFSALHAEGTITIGDSYSRWQRRRVVVQFPRGGHVQLGNVNCSLDNGLFYGYFPLAQQSYEMRSSNWLYGNARTWNGVAAEGVLGDKCKLTMLVHRRETESIAGIKTDVVFSRRMKCYTAVSGAVSDDGPDNRDTLVAVHGGITAGNWPWNMVLETGVNLLQAYSIPLSVTFSYGQTGTKSEFSCIRIPARFSAPRSSRLHTFYARLDIDEQADRDIYAVLLSSQHPISLTCAQRLDASYLVSGENAECRASYSLSGMVPFKYVLYYGLDAGRISREARHRLKGSVEHRSAAGHAVFSSLFYEVDQDLSWTTGLYCKADLSLANGVYLSPLVSFTIATDRWEDISVGIQQRIYFFEKTYGEAAITIPVYAQNNEHISFYAKTHFLF
jgi:hypothetical protein